MHGETLKSVFTK